MKILVASSLAIAAMTAAAVAEEPTQKDRHPAGLLQLSDSQMDQVTAAGTRFRQRSGCFVGCNNNNQAAQSGSNTSGDQTIGEVSLGLL